MFRPSDKIISIEVNDEVSDLKMKLGNQGEVFYGVNERDSLLFGRMKWFLRNSRLLLLLLPVKWTGMR